MRIHRFYISDIDSFNVNNLLVTHETPMIHQLKNVLRFKKGDILNIFNENIGEIEVSLDSLGKKDMSFKYIRQVKVLKDKKDKNNVSLYMSIIKKGNFDMVVEKAVELNIYNIIPVITERTIKEGLNFDRLNKIIVEATEQCGRLELLKIEKTMSLIDAIEDCVNKNQISYFGSINTTDIVLKKAQKNKAVFIGPEGGFTEKEEFLLKSGGVLPLNLGSNVLRAETAAIVGCAFLAL